MRFKREREERETSVSRGDRRELSVYYTLNTIFSVELGSSLTSDIEVTVCDFSRSLGLVQVYFTLVLEGLREQRHLNEWRIHMVYYMATCG